MNVIIIKGSQILFCIFALIIYFLSPGRIEAENEIDKPQINPGGVRRYGPFHTKDKGDHKSNCKIQEIDDDIYIVCLPFPIKGLGKNLIKDSQIELKSKKYDGTMWIAQTKQKKLVGHFLFVLPLDEMEPNFFKIKTIKRWLKRKSSFDEKCILSYKANDNVRIDDDWLCSSFFDTTTMSIYFIAQPTSFFVVEQDESQTDKKIWALLNRIYLDKELEINFTIEDEIFISTLFDLTDLYEKLSPSDHAKNKVHF